jgi:Zn-dependent protease with chaperone function
MKRLNFQLAALSAALLAAHDIPAAEKRLSLAELEQAFAGKSFIMLQAHNVAAKQYFRTAQAEYLCRHKPTGLFPNRHDLTNVSIVRVRQDSETEVLGGTSKLDGKLVVRKEITKEFRYWVFTLKHPHLGKGEFRITTADGALPDSKEEVRQILGFAFSGEGLPQHKLLRATKGGRLVHFIGSGHAPEEGDTVEFGGLEESAKAGYRTCALCFNRRMRLANFDAELQLGRETESTIRHYYQLSKDIQLQDRVERLGRKVLANWPSRLVGYDYRFNVIENGNFNAVACAGGYIFVHSGLVNLVESDEELEAVLAHEISHVEQRHGIKQLVRARRQANAAAIFGAILAGAAGAAAATADNASIATIATDAAAVFGIWTYAVGAQIARYGYSREQEMEADIYALNYFQKMGYDRRQLLSVLAKVRTSVDLANPRSPSEEDMSNSHPAPNNRIHLAKTIKVEQWPDDVTFDVFNKEDELVYSMTFQGACNYSRRDGSEYCKVLLDVSTTAALAETESVDELTIPFGNMSRSFTSDGSYELAPMDRIGMAFTYKGKLPLKPSDLSKPRLAGIEGAKVVRRSKSESE